MVVEREVAIQISHLNKVYKLYDKLRDRLKDAFGFKSSCKLHYALRDVSLSVYKGETVGIIGTNGSGKSTILKIITGVLHPTEGQCKVNGRISALLELGAGFNQEYNGIENIYLNGTMMGFSDKEIEEKIPAILEFADIGDYVYQPVKSYSSGMFVRLAFAVAINIDPEILIVDEALSVGDIFFQAKCYHKFEEFKKLGKTIVFVSHDLNSVSKYCDRVFLLNQGRLLGEGDPKTMIDAYKQVLVGQYGEKGAEAGRTPGNNPDVLEYGDGRARIEECRLLDEQGRETNVFVKGSPFTVSLKVHFTSELTNPIFAFSVKNVQGTEITGTNTMLERAFMESVKAGDCYHITFTQDANLQGGEYLISLGVTGYERDQFEVYHRLYDVMNMTVVSDKNTVGFYDCCSKVNVSKEM